PKPPKPKPPVRYVGAKAAPAPIVYLGAKAEPVPTARPERRVVPPALSARRVPLGERAPAPVPAASTRAISSTSSGTWLIAGLGLALLLLATSAIPSRALAGSQGLQRLADRHRFDVATLGIALLTGILIAVAMTMGGG
ncbi:MAG: hypothetical protein ABR521_13185, partial [Gaiellaceae bacterium]